jgi:hypothetical protein
MKNGFTLLNDGETALVVPFRLAPSRGSGWRDYRRAHVVRREGVTQEAFIETYGVKDGAEEFIAELRGKLKITDEQLKEAIQEARQNGTRRILRKLVGYSKSQRRAASQSY